MHNFELVVTIQAVVTLFVIHQARWSMTIAEGALRSGDKEVAKKKLDEADHCLVALILFVVFVSFIFLIVMAPPPVPPPAP